MWGFFYVAIRDVTVVSSRLYSFLLGRRPYFYKLQINITCYSAFMQISTRHKKWLKRLLALMIVIIAIGGGLLYIINYRLRDILQIVVNKESKGVYGFDAASIDISLLKK